MTTISPKRRRGPLQLRTLAYGFFFIVLFGFVFIFRTAAGSIFWRISEPMVKTRDNMTAAAGIFFGQFSSNQVLELENERLRMALASTSVHAFDRDLLYSENLDLRARMGRTGSSHGTLASVLERPPETPYDTLIIDAGKVNGVSVGDSVSAGGVVFIGSVEEVYAKSARVVLYSAGGESHDALLLSKKSSGEAVPVALSGQGAGSFVGEVPAGTVVSIDDMAIFPGLGERLVARVSAIDPPEGASFKKVYLQFPVNIFTLRFVEVHSKNEDEKK